MSRFKEAVQPMCSTPSQQLLDTSYLSRFKNFRILIWFSWNPWMCLWAFFFLNPRHIKWLFKSRQNVHKLHKHWANSLQANCDQRRNSCLSSSLSLEEVAVYVHHKVLWPSIFLIFIVWMNWRTLQPTTFLVGDWSHVLGSVQLVSHVLGVVHLKGKQSLQNKSNWVLG